VLASAPSVLAPMGYDMPDDSQAAHDHDSQRRLHSPTLSDTNAVTPLSQTVESLSRNTTVADHHAPEQTGKGIQDVEPPFCVYTTRQKWFIIVVASFAGLFRLVLYCKPECLIVHMLFKSPHSKHLFSSYPDDCRRISYHCRAHQRHCNSLHGSPGDL
jgi:hypothetical protein